MFKISSQIFFIMLLLFLCLDVRAQDHTSISDVQLKEFSDNLAWRRLLYYDSKGRSEIASPDFFLSPNGANDPYQEVVASYQNMFYQDPKMINDEHAICRFPARFYLLDKEFKANEFHKIKYCPKFLAFINRAAGQSISLVFSAYNLNSPSSAFGHTFLKINKQGQEGMDLLNYGINYAASTGGSNPLFYALNGLFGFFKGEFTAIPFYYKIREYNDFESRDIWEYELNLDYEDVQMLTMHFWELGSGWSWYYFLGKNCSYWALKSIEAVSLKYNFEKDLNRILVIPVETIKSLYKYEDLVKSVKYRPSIYKQLNHSLKDLSRSEKTRVKLLTEDLYHSRLLQKNQLLSDESIDVLDAAIFYYDYKYAKSYVKEENKTLNKKQPLLLARSQKGKSKIYDAPTPTSPEKIHPPQRVGVGYRTGQEFQSSILSYKMGFHELYDASLGMDAPLAMNYLDLNLRVYKLKESSDWKIDLDHLDVLRIDALSPANFMDLKMSWRLRLGVGQDLYSQFSPHKVGHANLDSGMAISLNQNETALGYFMLSSGVETGVRFKNKIRLNVAPLFGLKIHWTPEFATIVELKHRWYWNLDDLWQRQWLAEGVMQYYFSKSKFALYTQGVIFASTTRGQSLDDAHAEVGLRKFY